jgi:hypothetical protein
MFGEDPRLSREGLRYGRWLLLRPTSLPEIVTQSDQQLDRVRTAIGTIPGYNGA